MRYSLSPKKRRTSIWGGTYLLQYTPWLVRCCEMLEPTDAVLPWLVRYQHIISETAGLRKLERKYADHALQIGIMIKGMSSQLDEWQTQLPSTIASNCKLPLLFFFVSVRLSLAHTLPLSVIFLSFCSAPFSRVSFHTPLSTPLLLLLLLLPCDQPT